MSFLKYLDGHLLNVSAKAKPADVCVCGCVCVCVCVSCCVFDRGRQREIQNARAIKLKRNTVAATITIRLFVLFDVECDTMHE